MRPKFFGPKLSRTLMIVAVFGLLVFLNPYRLFSPVREAFRYLVTPFQKLAYVGSLKFSGTLEFFGSIGKLKQENDRLFSENQRLEAKSSMLADMSRENDFLREQLGLLPRDEFMLEAAYVTSRDPYGAGNWLEISKGRDYGIESGMPVVVSESVLLGRVGEVYEHSAQVVLVTNAGSLINAVDAETGARGVVHGEYNLGIIFDMVLPADTLKQGDSVVTSGTSEGTPRGLLIGKIDKSGISADGLFQLATVVPPVKIQKLDTVFVIIREK